jgi:hypothetical protein
MVAREKSTLATLADSVLRRVVDRAISLLQLQPSVLAGDGSGLGNVWLEFCTQVQGEETIDWEDFKLHVRQTIEGALFELDRIEQQTLWLRTPAGRDWLDEPGIDTTGDLPVDSDDLIELVYQNVYQQAIDWQDEGLQRFLCPES